MVLESISSPRIRSSSLKKRDELGTLSTLLQRHRFLLTALILLVFLCTVYLYFAVTLGTDASNASCSDLSGSEKALCKLEYAKSSMAKGKLKFF